MARAEAVFVLIAAALLVPGVDAAAPTADLIVADAPGDQVVTFGVNGNSAPPVPISAETFDHADITRITVGRESPEFLTFAAQFKRLDTPSDPTNALLLRRLTWTFEIASASYELSTERTPRGCAAELRAYDETARAYRPGPCQTLEPLASEREVTIKVARRDLLGDNRVPLRAGDDISSIQVLARTMYFYSGASGGIAYHYEVQVRDTAPDRESAGPFTSRFSADPTSNRIEVFAPEPIRASNGESTTFVYKVQIADRGTSRETLGLHVETNESTFRFRHPARVVVEPGKVVDVPIILTMEFGHRHGDVANFTLVAQSAEENGARGSTKLGVYWLEVPQPAGHHNRMWLHSADRQTYNNVAFASKETWMNPLEKDPNPLATDEPAWVGSIGVTNSALWIFPLRPSLRIGLDFDLTMPAHFETTIRTDLPLNDVYLNATLNLCQPRDGAPVSGFCNGKNIILATGTARASSIASQSSGRFEVPMLVRPEADLVPYQKGASVSLSVRLTAQERVVVVGQALSPKIDVRSSLLTLPLNEYHDPVDQAFQEIGSLTLRPLDPVEKPLNPGRTAVFRFDVTNTGEKAQDLRVSTEGHNAEWAQIDGGEGLALGPGDRRQVSVLVKAPEDAQPGERAELFFVVENVRDPSVVALSRIRASVVSVEAAEISDEASILDRSGKESTPGPGALPLVVLMALVAKIWGRRRL